MKKVWFKAKKFGWGWYPASWQGWLVTLLYVVYVVYRVNSVSSISELILPTIILLFICLYTGERPIWRGGKVLIFFVVISIIVAAFGIFSQIRGKPDQSNFLAPGKNWQSPKKVENYFIERLNMTPNEASEIRSKPGVDGKVNLRISNNVTLDGLVGNLYYYGFIRDEKTFRYALEHTKDTTPSGKAIRASKDGTIDTNAEYRISENMSAWELADLLLNKPEGHFSFDEYNYFFMP